jgi:hypothetical protein
MNKEELIDIADFCLGKIEMGQSETGEFKTFLYFPGKSENGWIYSGPSVFLTSSIAISLLNTDNFLAKNIREKAALFVRSQMEPSGLWRFYPHNGLFKFNTPMDVDDTCLASYLLKKCNIKFPENKEYILKQIDRKGNFYVWFLPRLRYLYSPSFFINLVFDLRYSFPIFFPLKGRTTAPLIKYNDYEHAVSSNAVLYLSKTKETQKTINHITEDVLFGNEHNMFFYPDFLFTLYHISRAYNEGISDFENLKQKVNSYFLVNKQACSSNILNKAISIITLLNFKINSNLVDEFLSDIIKADKNEIAAPYAYFCTKDRNMVGGSAEFTCAVVYDAIQKYLQK